MKLNQLAHEHNAEKLREIQDQHQYVVKRFLYFREQLNHLGKQYKQDFGKELYEKLVDAFRSKTSTHEQWPDSPTLFSYQHENYYGYWLRALTKKSRITTLSAISIIVPVEQSKDMISLIHELHEMYSTLQQLFELIQKYETTLSTT